MRRTVMHAEILTENLQLVLGTRAEVLAFVAAMTPSDRAEVSPKWLAQIESSTSSDPWLHGFTIMDRATGVVVGSCGFKGPPDPDAVVEIAYGVQPQYQGRGYATEVARALVAFAFDSGQVTRVRAHTQPENNASARVLAKCGFACLGEVMDPEDGLVWRWEIRSFLHPRIPVAFLNCGA